MTICCLDMSGRNLIPIIIICCIYVQIIWCNQLASCYTESPEFCPLTNECKCKKTSDTSLFCCQVQSNEDLNKNFICSGVILGAMRALHIYNMTVDHFSFAKLPKELSKLLSFSITNSSITRISGHLGPDRPDHPDHMPISCLNLSNNAFGTEWQEPQALENLKSLAMLDFSNVNISKLPAIKIQVPIFWLDVSNNARVQCEDVLALMKSARSTKYQLNFANNNNTFCISPMSYQWFNSSEKLALNQIESVDQLHEECPWNCTCNWYRLQIMRFEDARAMQTIQVDCSYRQLTGLPPKLPENTVLLNITNNNITNLDALVSDPTYNALRFLYADENKISSILPLEGSPFINNYIMLSLRYNQLKSLPTYILTNSFTTQFEGKKVHLGGNELLCDCSSAQTLKIWLLSNRIHIEDYNEILCENIQFTPKIIDLDQNVVCVTETNWTHYMYYVIAAELSVFLLLIGKVSYDYWVFKTAGYLPWPASKMPRLPCDWVFE